MPSIEPVKSGDAMEIKNQEVVLSGTKGSVRIKRMEGGFPHIHSDNEIDAYYGIGYMHGHDRQVQMWLMKLIGQGALSEHLVANDESITIDKYMRWIDLGGDARGEMNRLSSEAKKILHAYCKGVNDAVSASKRPFEFKMMGYKPDPWTPEDIIIMSRIIAFIGLTQSQGEIEKFIIQMIKNGVETQKIKELFPSIKEKIPKALVRIIQQIHLNPELTGIPPEMPWKTLLPNFQASNNWAVSPKKTKSGKAMLCGDPHLETNRLPSIWYESVLTSPNACLMGVGMPGVPFTVIGRTKKIAWSATYSFMDVIDYFIEDVKSKKYLRGNRRFPFRIRTETIRPKRKKPIVLKFYENDIGVIEGEPISDGYYLNFAWSSRKGTIAPSMEQLIKLPKSKNTKEAMRCFSKMSFGAFSWVIADVNGSIGFQMSGNFPKKAKNTSGLLPYCAWNPSQHWKGFVNPEKYPNAFNPRSGFIATANQDLNYLGKIKPLSITMGDYRAQRIAQRLQHKKNLTVQDMKDMHADTYSLQAKAFMKIIRSLLPKTRNGKILNNWNLKYDTHSKGAMLFERVYEELLKIVFGGNGLGSDMVNYCLAQTPIFNDFYANFDQILLKKKSKWFGKLTQKEIYRQAVENAMSGKAIPYGKYRKYYMTNIFFGGKLPRFLGFDYGPIQLHGSRATIPQGQLFMAGGRQTSFAPSYRMICDLAEDAIHTNIAGGPSDRRFSKYYTMGIKDWMVGRYKILQP